MNLKVATLFAETSSGDLFGTVADMFYFLRWQGTLSEWIPLIGGDFFTFFQYIDIILQMLFLRVHLEHLKFGIARIKASRKKLIWSLGCLILSTLSKPALRNYVCKLSKFIFTGELLKTISIHCYHSINKISPPSIF
jgi:hypothetical protein